MAMEILKSSITCNKVDKSDSIFGNTSIKKLFNAKYHTATSCKHWIKNENSLFLFDIFWKLVVKKYWVLVFAFLVPLDKHLANCNAWNEVHHFLHHWVSRSDYGNSTIFLLFVLKLQMIVVFTCWRKSLLFYHWFLRKSLFYQESHDAIAIKTEFCSFCILVSQLRKKVFDRALSINVDYEIFPFPLICCLSTLFLWFTVWVISHYLFLPLPIEHHRSHA